MSELNVEVVKLNVEPHPDADRLDIVRPDGTAYVCISQKDRFKTGEMAVYVGEGSVVPEALLKDSGFWDEEHDKGMLAGSRGDRVKAIKLRGIISQGILIDLPTAFRNTLPLPAGRIDHESVGSSLGITKYVPPIPSSLDGEVYPCDTIPGYTEIENFKRYPNLLQDGEEVVATEKIHGSCAVYHLDGDGTMHVASKGFAKKGLALVRNEHNGYWQMAELYDMLAVLHHIRDTNAEPGEAVTLYAEIHGQGVQDLQYGLKEKRLRVFDIRVGRDRWMPYFDMQQALLDASYYTDPDARPLGWVPLLYGGEFDRDLLVGLANEKGSTIDPGTVREGIVVKAQPERHNVTYGRAIVKMISDKYLSRKGGTEYE